MASVQIDDVRTEINLLMKIPSKERSAMQQIRCRALVQIDDVRTEENLLLKISPKERSALQKIRLHQLQQRICYFKNKLWTGRGIDAAKIIRKVDKHQVSMSWKDNTPKLVRDECLGTRLPASENMLENTSQGEKHKVIALPKVRVANTFEIRKSMSTIL